jgi:hypothetical protein
MTMLATRSILKWDASSKKFILEHSRTLVWLLQSTSCVVNAGEGADAVYSNSSDAEQYLCKQSPGYMGGHAVLYHDRCGAE